MVIALVAETPMRNSSSREIAAFGTPTVVHFCSVLSISAMLSAPWRTLSGPAILLGIGGILGVAYVIVVVLRARAQTGYKPVLEDWLWHVVFPFIAYTTLLVAALSMERYPTPALFAVGAASLLLLFIGIHNAWDTVTYIAIERPQGAVCTAKGPPSQRRSASGVPSTPLKSQGTSSMPASVGRRQMSADRRRIPARRRRTPAGSFAIVGERRLGEDNWTLGTHAS